MKTRISRSFVCVVTIFVMFVVVAGVANAQSSGAPLTGGGGNTSSGLSGYRNRNARKQAESEILTAVKKDDLDAVVACVKRDHTLINTVDDSENGQTLVHLAVKAENLTVLKCLIAWDASLEIQDKNGKTPLKVAVEAKKVEAVRYLLVNKADIESITYDELDALPLGDFEDGQYIVEKSEEEVKRLIAKEQVARAAAAQADVSSACRRDACVPAKYLNVSIPYSVIPATAGI